MSFVVACEYDLVKGVSCYYVCLYVAGCYYVYCVYFSVWYLECGSAWLGGSVEYDGASYFLFLFFVFFVGVVLLVVGGFVLGFVVVRMVCFAMGCGLLVVCCSFLCTRRFRCLCGMSRSLVCLGLLLLCVLVACYTLFLLRS